MPFWHRTYACFQRYSQGKTVFCFSFCEFCRLFPPKKEAATNRSNSWVQLHLMEMIFTLPTVLMISNDPEPSLASCMSPQVPSLLPVKCTPCPSQKSQGGLHDVLSHTPFPSCSHACRILTGGFACRPSPQNSNVHPHNLIAIVTDLSPLVQAEMRQWGCGVALQHGKEVNQCSAKSYVTGGVHMQENILLCRCIV